VIDADHGHSANNGGGDSPGYYQFTGPVPAGNYSVRSVRAAQGGSVDTTVTATTRSGRVCAAERGRFGRQRAGQLGREHGDGHYAVGDAGLGRTQSELDAGLYQAASLGDFVWIDLNGNGIQNAGEPGLNGVTVNLLDAAAA
jgi:hypothetical protein